MKIIQSQSLSIRSNRSRLRLGQQAGAAAVPVVMALFFIMGVIFFYANRGLIFEQRSSANQYRYTQAFETAEAGLEWAVSMLNSDRFIDSVCQPITSAPTSTSSKFRSRFISVDTSSGSISGTSVRAACVITATGLPSCSCPTSGTPTLTEVGPTFQLEFASSGQAGSVQVISHGCTSTGDAEKDPRCLPGGTGRSDGYVRVSVILGLIPALGSAPASTITARGGVTTQGTASSLGIYNPDPSTNGITINAGGAVDISNAAIGTVPGSSPESSIIPFDPSLAADPNAADALFSSYFNMTKSDFKKTATVLTCNPCRADDVSPAYNQGARIFWIEGSLNIQSKFSFGGMTAPDSPVVVVVDGPAELSGGSELVGMLYVTGNFDQQGSGNFFLRGAAVTEGSMVANANSAYYYDAGVLKSLGLSQGRFGRIAGSWKDFQ